MMDVHFRGSELSRFLRRDAPCREASGYKVREEGVRNVGDDSKVFVGRGFSHDINNAAAKGLQPLKFPRAGNATHFSAREAICAMSQRPKAKSE